MDYALETEGEAWSEDESVSFSGSREGNVCNEALHVIGLYGPGDKISLFLQDCVQRCLELSRGPGHAVPGNGSWVMLPRGLLSRHEYFPLTVDGL